MYGARATCCGLVVVVNRTLLMGFGGHGGKLVRRCGLEKTSPLVTQSVYQTTFRMELIKIAFVNTVCLLAESTPLHATLPSRQIYFPMPSQNRDLARV